MGTLTVIKMPPPIGKWVHHVKRCIPGYEDSYVTEPDIHVSDEAWVYTLRSDGSLEYQMRGTRTDTSECWSTRSYTKKGFGAWSLAGSLFESVEMKLCDQHNRPVESFTYPLSSFGT